LVYGKSKCQMAQGVGKERMRMKRLFWYADTGKEPEAGRVDCCSRLFGNLYSLDGEILFRCKRGGREW